MHHATHIVQPTRRVRHATRTIDPARQHDAKQLARQMAAEGEAVALQASARACVAVRVHIRVNYQYGRRAYR